jgi:hypothetical protein
VQVGGELRGVVLAGGDVVVGGDDLAPGLQARAGDAGDGRRLHRPAGLALVQRALVVQAPAAGLVGLVGGARGRQQALHRIERAVGVVGVEGVVVRPAVAGLAQLAGHRLLRPRQPALEDAPRLGEHLEQQLRVVLAVASVGAVLRGVACGEQPDPVLPGGHGGGHRLVDEGREAGGEQLEAAADPVAVARGHGRYSSSSRSSPPWMPAPAAAPLAALDRSDQEVPSPLNSSALCVQPRRSQIEKSR